MNSLSQSPGIYKIVCVQTGKIYVGSTVNLRKRWYEHRGALRANRHDNRHLQSAWNKYGESSFYFEIIEYVMPFALLIREQWWLDHLKPYDKQGYNITKHAESPGLNPSAETRRLISIAGKGKPHTAEHSANISTALKGHEVSTETRAKISNAHKGKRQSTESIQKTQAANSQRWIVTDPQGNESQIFNLNQFCRENNLNSSCMCNVAQGVYSQYKGWKCQRA